MGEGTSNNCEWTLRLNQELNKTKIYESRVSTFESQIRRIIVRIHCPSDDSCLYTIRPGFYRSMSQNSVELF